ncbi:MAG: hypothetical protein FJX76_02260 [Armatimonadetes bacterium]|nr:hypothetical protein [Armatimonadota bacterium]
MLLAPCHAAGKGPKMSIDVANADVGFVLKLITKKLGYNLVTDKTVVGVVTLSLKDVPAQRLLILVLRLTNLQGRLMDGNTLVVASPEVLSDVPGEPIP